MFGQKGQQEQATKSKRKQQPQRREQSLKKRSNDDENDGVQKSSHRSNWFSNRTKRREGKHDEDDNDNDPSTSPTKSKNDDNDNNNEDDTSEPSRSSICKTVPDRENEWHYVIRNHNWEALDNLLKGFDIKKYKQFGKPRKRRLRKLRIVKYLPEMPKTWPFSKNDNNEDNDDDISPLLWLDAVGRTPLHLACIEQVPNKLLLKLLFVQRDAASVCDVSNGMPLHVAIRHERNLEVIDKIIRGYPQASWTIDGTGRTPLMWAVEVVQRLQQEQNPPIDSTYWGFPSRPSVQKWQKLQVQLWQTVFALLENREARRKTLIKPEYRLIVTSLGLAAPPEVIQLFLTVGKNAFEEKESQSDIAGPALGLCIIRQYPLSLLQSMIELCPNGIPKSYKDPTGRGLVAAHYRIACTPHLDDSGDKKSSFRIIMQQVANAKHVTNESFDPPAPYLDWWDKLKYLLNIWGSSEEEVLEDVMLEEGITNDDLLLHRALSNSDVPPSLIQLLDSMFPNSASIRHPKSRALPIHIASRVWRYRSYPPRKGEKENCMGKMVNQLLEKDPTRTRLRYRGRLPLHHAIASRKGWNFLKPLVTMDPKTLYMKDPTTKLYPFQLAAMKPTVVIDFNFHTRIQYTPSEWNRMRDYQQDHEIRAVEHVYDLEQLSTIFGLLRAGPDAIDEMVLRRNEELEKQAAAAANNNGEYIGNLLWDTTNKKRGATEEVAAALLAKAIRAEFQLGLVSGHFISWCYEKISPKKGWNVHRFHLANVNEAIMDGFIPLSLDSWWRKLKFWIWYTCTMDEIPRKDEFLLHAALSNPDTPPHVIKLLLECFPRSASIALPGTRQCYPLHIAVATAKYIELSFEVVYPKTVIEMTVSTFPDACYVKYQDRLPIHTAILNGKTWNELAPLVAEAQVTLAVPDPQYQFLPFQLMAVDRPYSDAQQARFEVLCINEMGRSKWNRATGNKKVACLRNLLNRHERMQLTAIWEMLKRDPLLLTFGIIETDEEPDMTNGTMHAQLLYSLGYADDEDDDDDDDDSYSSFASASTTNSGINSGFKANDEDSHTHKMKSVPHPSNNVAVKQELDIFGFDELPQVEETTDTQVKENIITQVGDTVVPKVEEAILNTSVKPSKKKKKK